MKRASGQRQAEKLSGNQALQPRPGLVEVAMMKRNPSSEDAGRLDNTLEWDVIQTCIITRQRVDAQTPTDSMKIPYE
jgi:hypothetical protein